MGILPCARLPQRKGNTKHLSTEFQEVKNQKSAWAGQDSRKLVSLQEERLQWGVQGFGGPKERTG